MKTKEKNVPMQDAVITKTSRGGYMAQGNDGKGNKMTTMLSEATALEAVKNQQTLAELAKKFEVNPVMISKWKAEFMENLSATFEREEVEGHQEQDTEKLYAQIGQLKVENDFLKKSCKKLGIEI